MLIGGRREASEDDDLIAMAIIAGCYPASHNFSGLNYGWLNG